MANTMAASAKPKETFSSQKIIELRKTIFRGHTDRTISDEFFVFDLLKSLCDDDIDEMVKLQLLEFLEENAAILIDLSSMDSPDHVISSLLDIYNESVKKGSVRKVFIGQLLVTMTSITIVFDTISIDIRLQLLGVLLGIISLANDTQRMTVKLRALCCLREMELSHPGLLSKKLDSLYTLMKEEKTYLYQEYVRLFTAVLRHVVYSLAAQFGTDGSLPQHGLSSTLFHSRDTLTNYTLEDYEENATSREVTTLLPDSLDTKELTLSISYIVDNHACFTPPSLSAIFDDIADIILVIPSLPALVFKPIVLQQMSTLNIVLFQSLLRLKIRFGDQLFASGDITNLVRHQVALANNPLFTSGHRLLLLHWLMHFNPDKPDEERLPDALGQGRQLYPSVFDGVDTHATKLRLVNLLSHPRGLYVDQSYSERLVTCLNMLHALVVHGNSHKTSTALFKSLYQFYKHHAEIRDSLKQMVIRLASSTPRLVPYIINFLERVSLLSLDSDDCKAVLLSLHEQVLSCIHDNQPSIPLTYILQVLHKVTMDTTISPKSSIVFVRELLEKSRELAEGQWNYGNGVLRVIRNLLYLHTSDDNYMELANLIHFVMTSYFNLEIRDHATLYYMLLTSSSQPKINMVLSEPEKDGQSLANIVGDANTYIHGKTLTLADEPVFSLKQESCVCHWAPDLPTESRDAGISQDATGSVQSYYETLSQFKATVQLNFSFTMLSGCNDDTLYAISLHARECEDNYEQVPAVSISVLRKKDIENVCFQLTPKKPLPSTFHMHAMYCNLSRQTMFTELGQFTVHFSDLYMPLPWRLSDMTLYDLHASLWDDIESRANNVEHTETTCIQSVHTIDTSLDKVAAILCQYSGMYLPPTDNVSYHSLSIFLPPSCHFLMRLHQQHNCVVMRTTMDQWCILGKLQAFLDSIKEGVKS